MCPSRLRLLIRLRVTGMVGDIGSIHCNRVNGMVRDIGSIYCHFDSRLNSSHKPGSPIVRAFSQTSFTAEIAGIKERVELVYELDHC